MKIEKALKQLKKEYRSVSPRREFREHGWEEIRGLLDEGNSKYWFARSFAFRLVIVSLFLFLVSGGTIVVAAQKARPGDTFYPVKQFSEHVVTAIKEIKILPRTNQIPEAKNSIQSKKEEPSKTEEKTTESSPSAKNDKREEKEKIKDEVKKEKEKVKSSVQSEVKGKEIRKGEKKEEKGNENPVGEAEQKVQDIINRLTQ